MKRLLTLLTLASLSLMGCEEQPAINQVGVNVVDKSLFAGSWYYSTVVIDVDYAASGLGTYPGDAAYDFAVGGITSMPRVRWVIDEDTLFAFRDYELIEGANIGRDGQTEEPGDVIHQPVAAFAIESHFDIRRDYNATTGEENNVLVENSTDDFWYERDFMRVDWSLNLLPNYYGQVTELYEILGLYSREPSTLFVQGASDFPDSWRPQFDFMSCTDVNDESCGAERDHAGDFAQGEFYHFSFVTQDLLSPGVVANPFTGRPVNYCLSPYAGIPDCASTAVYVRNSFLKVSDTREYVAENWNPSRFDRHGYFSLERSTYDRSSDAGDAQMGYTDFLNYNVNRHNIWRDWIDDEGNAVPFGARQTRPLVYYTSTELPAHLVEPSFDLVGAWSQVFMRMVRNLRGQADADLPRMDCQTTDPEAYCFCTANPETGDILNASCEGHWTPFTTPDEYRAQGVTDPYDCWVEIPDGAQPDMENPALSDENFYGWYGASFQGTECMVDLRINTCTRASIAENGGTTDGLECQERGDMRYNLLSYVDQPGTPFLGVATLRGDPVTGEIRAGDANIGGPALDGYRTSALQQYDLINGGVTDRNFLIGEDVRDYLENVDRIQQPSTPREPFLTATSAGAQPPAIVSEAIRTRMGEYASRGSQLAGPEGRARTFVDRLQLLAGTDTERRLMANEETLAMAGIDILPPGVGTNDINDDILDRVSPFRVSASEQLEYQRDLETRVSSANMMMPNEFVDASVLEFVNRHRDWNRAKLEIVINQLLYYQTQLHELGHCLGLRHDFGASADIANYDDDYYIINDALPNADPADYDLDGTPGLNADEQVAYGAAYTARKDLRELAGVDRWMNSSIMEYTAQWYERTSTTRGAGRYDHSAINNAYGDLTEVYDNSAGVSLADMNPTNTDRIWIKYYHGGEACNVDADCPYAPGGANEGLLLSGNAASGLVQRCVAHPNGAERGNICSSYDTDVTNLTAAGGDAPRYVAVNYNFCTDDLAGLRADCHRFDEGDSYREVVANISEQYDRQYIFTNFRRYRSGYSLGGYLFGRLIGRQYNILQSIFQNLLFKYVNDPEYAQTTGNFGFEDHFLATADTMNFYARVIAQPALGSYFYNEGWDRYQRDRSSDRADIPGAHLSLPLGMARYGSSEYQSGLTGITRLERIGTFYEKYFTMQMLTDRGYTTSYSRDVPFWTNYYDLFPQEMQDLFQGMILNQPERIAPRVTCGGGAGRTCEDPQLIYMDYYAGDCSNPATCRPTTEERYAGLEHVDTGAGATLQFLASALTLANFPVFFDTTFQNQMFVCVDGEGDCPNAAAGDVLGDDYIEYASANYGKVFRAWQVEGQADVPNQRSIGFEMISEANDLSFLLEALKAYRGDYGGPSLSAANLSSEQRDRLRAQDYTLPGDATELVEEVLRVDGRLRGIESFFFQTQQLLRQYGVASYLRF